MLFWFIKVLTWSGKVKFSMCELEWRFGERDSSVVTAPDWWSRGPGFESPQERRENFLLQSRLSVLTVISMSVPRLVKDPGHCAKSTGGRLPLDAHAPYQCGFEWNDTVNWCIVVCCIYNLCRDGSSCTWHQPRNNQIVLAESAPLRWMLKNAL